jgi:hypothetical protein
MFLTETTGDRWHLKGGWRGFAREWDFSEGQEINFTEYKCNRGKILVIGRI